MALLVFEFKKLLEQPMIFIFLGLCLVFNMAWVLSANLDQKYLNYVESVQKEIGTSLTPDMKKELVTLPEQKFKNRLVQVTEEKDNLFLNTSVASLAERVTSFYQLDGRFKEKVETKYQRLEPVVMALGEKEAALDLAVADETMSYFTFIRNVLIRFILAEGLIFSLLIGLFTSTSEQMTKTNQTILTTKTGRKVQVKKYVAGLLVSLLFFTIVVIGSFGFFSLMNPLGTIWTNSISTQFHLNVYFPNLLELPFITWIPMTLRSYTFLAILLSYILLLSCFSFHFIIGLWLDNLFKGFVLTVSLITIHKGAVLWSMKVGAWPFFNLLTFLPMDLWENQMHWFTEMGPFSTIPFQESVVGLVTLMVIGIALGMTCYWYPKKEVV